jgi:DNA-directed RNA polymerase specialized sigma24 family protein
VQVIPDATEVGYALRGADGVLVRGARSRSTAAKTQLVLRLLSADPAPSYAEISAAIGIPTGSIGPTRVRVLHRLRTLLEQGLIA